MTGVPDSTADDVERDRAALVFVVVFHRGLGHLQCSREFRQRIDRVHDERRRGFTFQFEEESAGIVNFPKPGFVVGCDVQFHATTAASSWGLRSRVTSR